MSKEETYNGWANRETWAVALHINNDQGWQESVLEALRTERDRLTVRGESDGIPSRLEGGTLSAHYAGDVIRDNVESLLTVAGYQEMTGEDRLPAALSTIAEDVGSLYRVDWTELGRSFLEDLEGEDMPSSS